MTLTLMNPLENPIEGVPLSLDRATKSSDLSESSRSIHIVTTASLPWLTGTAVNPLLRALYFQKSRTGKGNVTLVIPWVVKQSERQEVYPNHNFDDGKDGRREQEELVRKWIVEKAGMMEESKLLRIQFYPASYQKKLGSILTLVDICSLIPKESADIAILEEPEHLTWFAMPAYSHGKEKTDDFLPNTDIGWMAKFNHVVGIIHTNYPAYARQGVMRGSRTIASRTIHALSKLVCRSYCHKIIKLSSTLPVFAEYKECVCNVHGVRSDFLRSDDAANNTEVENKDSVHIYFIGKLLFYGKGFNIMLECEKKYRESTGDYFPIDIYGGGPEEEQIKRAFFGVRGKSGDMNNKPAANDSFDEDSDDEKDEGKELDNEENKEKDSVYSRLSQMMLLSMPFLEDEMKSEEASSTPDKPSTIQTLKDGFQLVRNFQKKTLLKKVPKNKYEWRKTPIPARFLGPRDHAALKFTSYKIFVNPSITEVLCTTSAEALAMGKFVVLPKHPSNEFFYQFPNCLVYEDMKEFVEHIKYALEHDPVPLKEEMARIFTWDAAMERLTAAAAITESEYILLEQSGKLQLDKRKAWIHKESGKMIKGDVLRTLVGDPPTEDLKDYEINDEDGEGFLLTFENSNSKLLALLSFIIAILSYFAQR